jgi:hypothetical protein
MVLLKRSLPFLLAVSLVFGAGAAFVNAKEGHCYRGGGGAECQGPVDNGGDGLPGAGPGVL